MKQWVKLIQGLRIQHRLQKQYVNGDLASITPIHNQLEEEFDAGDGFMQPGTVIQPFTLPKNTHLIDSQIDHGGSGNGFNRTGGSHP